jgi:GNAT superfamily N-acetyltransferase
MDIRLCRPADEENWLALNREFMSFEISDEEFWNDTGSTGDAVFKNTFRNALQNPAMITMFIFEEEGAPVGFANLMTIYSIWAHGKALILDDLYLKEECRGKGYGRKAMEHIEKYAKENGYKRLQFMSKPGNTISKNFYHALKFTPIDMYFYVKHL